ncbi:hypothetical protein BB561_000911 [Smittium simulii]|uniref:RING-type domain-containing protein n=1 Tax=Smittium simulii TaxID=133385 RepID=A0A2T9YX07_9FUNG|nr:hypothetical protein BB561_000911 [Smittium simulii]
MKCGYCNLEQEIGQYCKGCGECMGKYYCEICKFLDNSTDKGIFHCSKCGLCRKGHQKNFYHCDGCSACISIHAKNNHVCIENSLKSDCAVCMEHLFTSVEPVVILKCGHPIHAECVKDLLNFSNRSNDGLAKCPTCQHSITEPHKFSREMDQILALQPMPSEYRNKKSCVFCNDCHLRSQVPYHFVYHKCNSCGSYNTTVL